MARTTSPHSERPGQSSPAEKFDFPKEDSRNWYRWMAGAWGDIKLNRWVLYSVLLLYVLLTLRSNLRFPVQSSLWFVLASTVSPAGHVLAILLLIPSVWRFRWGFKKRVNFLLSLLAGLITSEVVLAIIVAIDYWFRTKAGLPSARLWPVLHGYMFIVSPSATLVGGLIAARARDIEEKDAVKEEAVAARTRLLQSQMHPHVLFNALNNLAELIHKDPPTAETSVRHLADLLRRILNASEHEVWSLGEEKQLVKDYLVIEGLRLGYRLRVTWDWDRSLDGVLVPPLLIQPLVENAIKHGISPSRNGGDLVIRAMKVFDDLVLEVWNSGEPYRDDKGWGIGLNNLSARLDLLGASAEAFTIGAAKEGTLATVRLRVRLLD